MKAKAFTSAHDFVDRTGAMPAAPQTMKRRGRGFIRVAAALLLSRAPKGARRVDPRPSYILAVKKRLEKGQMRVEMLCNRQISTKMF